MPAIRRIIAVKMFRINVNILLTTIVFYFAERWRGITVGCFLGLD